MREFPNWPCFSTSSESLTIELPFKIIGHFQILLHLKTSFFGFWFIFGFSLVLFSFIFTNGHPKFEPECNYHKWARWPWVIKKGASIQKMNQYAISKNEQGAPYNNERASEKWARTNERDGFYKNEREPESQQSARIWLQTMSEMVWATDDKNEPESQKWARMHCGKYTQRARWTTSNWKWVWSSKRSKFCKNERELSQMCQISQNERKCYNERESTQMSESAKMSENAIKTENVERSETIQPIRSRRDRTSGAM